MDSDQLLANQWQTMASRHQQVSEEIEQLKRKKNGFREDPNIAKLLAEKERIKKQLPQLKDLVQMHKEETAMYDQWKAEKLYTSDEWELREEEATQKKLQEATDRLSAIEEQYRQEMEVLQETIHKKEQRRQQCHDDKIAWAGQNYIHLTWILNNEPSYKDDAIRCYQLQHPEDNLSDICPIVFSPQSNSSPVRMPRPNKVAAVVVPEMASPPQPWKFYVTFGEHQSRKELPSTQKQFIKELQTALSTVDYEHLPAKLAYKKLIWVGNMSVQQRQEMDKVLKGEPIGWKILHVGKKHRLFLFIDETNRQIVFLPCPRKNAYLDH